MHHLTLRSIVVVHGLNGHRDKTWEAANGVHWLRDLLPNDIPKARIFCWGYDANTHGGRVSCQYLYDHARSLVSDLCLERRLTNVGYRTEVSFGQQVLTLAGNQEAHNLRGPQLGWHHYQERELHHMSLVHVPD
jgi:hypothetical protein